MIQWGVAHAALAGEPKCGDSHLVKLFAGGALIAVLDGIGHGEEACRAVGVFELGLETEGTCVRLPADERRLEYLG